MCLGTGRRGSNGQIISVDGNGALDNGGKQDPTFVLRKHSLSNSISQSVSILESQKVFVDCFHVCFRYIIVMCSHRCYLTLPTMTISSQ